LKSASRKEKPPPKPAKKPRSPSRRLPLAEGIPRFEGLKMDQAKRMKKLEKENGKLKRLVAELALDKQILKDIAEGNF
jgi:hypothetical protein